MQSLPFHLLQKSQVDQTTPKKSDEEVIVNGDVETTAQAEVPVQAEQTQPDCVTIALPQVKSVQAEPDKKPVAEAMKNAETTEEIVNLDNSFILTPDYIQQSKFDCACHNLFRNLFIYLSI